ncbi:MAG: DUF4166 domain-containing protein [Hyphomicrobiaceae bacterium]|nr:DUF4166 domain-containing protein [Hyphomicrobiaceae bacterium]
MTEITDEAKLEDRRSCAAAVGGLAVASHARPETRFRDLLGPEAWYRLPAVIRERFSRNLAPGESRLFHGEVVETSVTTTGRLLARLAAIFGSALPDEHGATGPATVMVTERPDLGGQLYARLYTRSGLPQTICSVKRFAGPTGLEEAIGAGLLMRLTVHVEPAALVFRSAGYAVEIGGLCVSLPRWLEPGSATITHRDEGGGRFTFELTLDHPWLGRLVHQTAHFEELPL